MTFVTQNTMSFSWKGLLLAPLVVPLAFAALLAASNPGKSPLFGFVLFTALGGIVSYPTTLLLFLPCLYLLSRYVHLKWYWVCLLGLALGVLVFFPITWIEFQSSGPDSGPPQGTFLDFLWRSRTDAITYLFPLAGVITAAAYWFLASFSAHPDPVAEY